jgi:hypothetical protein
VPDLDEQLREYGWYLDELAQSSDLPRARVHQGRRVMAAALVAIVLGVGVVIGLTRLGSEHQVTTVRAGDSGTAASTPSTTTVPAPTIFGLAPTFEQQVAQLDAWYKDWPAEAPGGRPVLEAEVVFCVVPTSPVAPPAMQFASYFPLNQQLTEARLVDACLNPADRFPGGSPANTPKETPVDALPEHVLCSSQARGPVYNPALPAPSDPVTKPVVVLGTAACSSLGYQDFPSALLTELNTRRRVEIEIRAVPTPCPTEAQATAWVESVTTAEFGEPWTTGAYPSSSSADICFRPMTVDWDSRQVELGQF